MTSPNFEPAVLDPAVCTRALGARDPRFDGLFFVGITSTRIYCRPICPARVSIADHRRFFDTAAAAELAGYRPCLRCRPELAPGRARVDAVPRLAERAAHRIEAGALNGQGVGALAEELGVSARHLRRALERELGVSPIELARTHRLLLAKRLLADTDLPVTRIAFASGFQSLRRFNAAFQERYHLSPSAVRRPGAGPRPRRIPPAADPDLVRLTLAYRPPLAWEPLIGQLRQEQLDGLEVVEAGRYARTLRVGDHAGVVLLSHAGERNQVEAEVSSSLLPVLMPLIARLRHLLDLDAQPTVVDRQLAEGGLEPLVRVRPGLRIPGTLDGFEIALRTVLHEAGTAAGDPGLARRLLHALGESATTGIPGLTRYFPSAAMVSRCEPAFLLGLGVPSALAGTMRLLAEQVATGRLRLEPQHDPVPAFRALVALGISPRWASTIVTRALYWPDVFDASDPLLLRAAGVPDSDVLERRAEQWRPWRTYAALHLRLSLHPDPDPPG